MQPMQDENGKKSSSRLVLVTFALLFVVATCVSFWRPVQSDIVSGLVEIIVVLSGAIGVRTAVKNWRD